MLLGSKWTVGLLRASLTSKLSNLMTIFFIDTSASLLQVDTRENTLNLWIHEGPEEEREGKKRKSYEGGRVY